ncbi:MAG: hypothetical protein RLY16_2288 [Bacteroidota bacterium]|jgi:hypothetical protein
MNKKILPILLVLFIFSTASWAQKANMIFYTANEEKFFLVINGIQQNAEPMSNIHLTDMSAPVIYSVRIKFQNPNIAVIDDKVSVTPDMEKTWIIQPKVKNAGNTGLYVIRTMGEIPIESDRVGAPVPPSQIVVYHSDPLPNLQGGEGVSFNMNVNDQQGNVNFNMGVSAGSNHNNGMNSNVQMQTTSSQTSSTYSSQSNSNVQQVGGRCLNPLTNSEFAAQLDRVRSQSTAGGKQIVAEKIVQAYCLTAVQISTLCSALVLSTDKLALAKAAYSRCYDPQNYEEVYKAFSTSSMVRELDEFIARNPIQGGTPIRQSPIQQQPAVVVYVPGYNGPVGCAMPMNAGDFSSAKQSISDADFENTKLSTAKTIVGANCLTADQVAQICALFDFEDSKLQFAKFAYKHTYDRGNYFKINKVFDFDASKEELNRFVQKGGN